MDTIELRSVGALGEPARGVSLPASGDASPGSMPWAISVACCWVPDGARASSRWPWSSAALLRNSRRSSKAPSWQWQRFITQSPWEAQDVQQEIQAVFNEEFVPTASQSPTGTVGVIDGSGFVKHGTHSCGVQRQWCGNVGKKENCQVGVFLLGVTPAGSVLLDHRLYLPESWAADAARRKETRVPAGDHLPNQAADRRRPGGAKLRAFRLDHGRRGVRA